jgi:hypothetical protein
MLNQRLLLRRSAHRIRHVSRALSDSLLVVADLQSGGLRSGPDRAPLRPRARPGMATTRRQRGPISMNEMGPQGVLDKKLLKLTAAGIRLDPAGALPSTGVW